MPKAKHSKWGEPKTEGLYQRMTPTGIQLLRDRAEAAGVSVADYLEMVARHTGKISASWSQSSSNTNWPIIQALLIGMRRRSSGVRPR